MITKQEIRQLIEDNRTAEAIEALAAMIEENANDDELYFLRGNAYRKHNDWRNAMSDYCRATEINPESPAKSSTSTIPTSTTHRIFYIAYAPKKKKARFYSELYFFVVPKNNILQT